MQSQTSRLALCVCGVLREFGHKVQSDGYYMRC